MQSKAENKIIKQNISLPKVGGSTQDFDEKSQIQESNGNLSFSFLVPTTNCRDITPNLSVSYNSSSRNSSFGLGWNINLSKISRKTSKGIPQYNENDNFILDSQDLVAIDNANGQENINDVSYNFQKYYLRDEGSLSLIKFYQNPQNIDDSFWKIIDRNHNIFIYGYNSSAKICDVNNKSHNFSWLLEEHYNDKGDHQVFYYKKEDGVNVKENNICLNNSYISKIIYGCDVSINDSMILNSNPVLQDESKWHFEIIFDYGEYNIEATNQNPYQPAQSWPCRNDVFSSYNSGFEVRNYRICNNILMFHRFSEINSNPTLVDALQFEYDLNYTNIASMLIKAKNTGYKFNSSSTTYDVISTPYTEISYSEFSPTNSSFKPIVNDNNTDLTSFNEVANYHFVDLFSEGVCGILYSHDLGSYYSRPDLPNVTGYNATLEIETLFDSTKIESGDVKFQNWELLESFPNCNEINLIDVNGNGLTDLMVNQGNINGYFEANSNQKFNNFLPFDKFPTDYKEKKQKLVDMTGNGLSDLVQINDDEIRIYVYDAFEGFSNVIQKDLSINNFPNSLESSPTKMVDFINIDGSSMKHLTIIDNNQVSYFPNLGYGNFGDEIIMQNSPQFDVENFNIKNLFFADLDGSSTMDLIYFESTKFTIYFNSNGNKFSDPLTIDLPTIDDVTLKYDDFVKISFADIKARGNSCLIFSDSKNEIIRHFYYDFCQGNKPYLINSIDNNLGATTKISYCSSTDFYLANKKAGINNIVNSPFPVHVAYKISYNDVISNSTYEQFYAYNHGYYDGKEREFRGFGRVDEQDSQYYLATDDDSNYCSPCLKRNWYNLGIFDPDNEIYNQFAKEFFAQDKNAFTMEQNVINLNGAPSENNDYLAYITLANQVIRSEIYGLDCDIPYEVSENNYLVNLLQAKGSNLYASFTTTSRREINYKYEKNADDPLITQQITVSLDDYDNITQKCEIYHPRRQNNNAVSGQQNLRFTYESMKYYNSADSEDDYLLGIVTQEESYEITGLDVADNYFPFSTIKTIIQEAIKANSLKLFSTEKYYYMDGNNVILENGKATLPLLLAREDIGAFNQDILDASLAEVLLDQLDSTLTNANYVQDSTNEIWYATGMLQQYYSSTDFYLPSKVLDPQQNATSYIYDQYNLIITQINDALNNKVTGAVDYVSLSLTKITDINNNISQVTLDPLRRIIYSSAYGTCQGKEIGFTDPIPTSLDVSNLTISDILQDPSKYLANMQSFSFYDANAFVKKKEPTQILTINSTTYSSNPDNYPASASPAMEITIKYIDGFGRNKQTKNFVEEGEAISYNPSSKKITKVQSSNRWLTSGYVVYDNKGNIVKEYEPYYFDSPYYVDDELIKEFGYSSTHFYDPLNREMQVITAKGFLTKYEITAWQKQIFDENDTISDSLYYKYNVTNPDPSSIYYDSEYANNIDVRNNIDYVKEYCYNTAITNIFDNLGNIIIEQEINNSPSLSKFEVLQTQHSYDILGNLITSSDPRLSKQNIKNFSTIYSLDSMPLKTISADNGTSWSLSNSVSDVIFNANSRNLQLYISYDKLHRIQQVKAVKQKSTNDDLVLNQIVEQFIYGDDQQDVSNPQDYNLCGELFKHYDSAGLIAYTGYDISKNVTQCYRSYIHEFKNTVNWNKISSSQLGENFGESFFNDALGRVVQETDVDNNVTNIKYYQSGRLSQLSVTTSNDKKTICYFSDIIYDAKSQRQKISYNNGIDLTYSYDQKTLEITNITGTRISDNEIVQNLNYLYDPVGNVIQKSDLTKDSNKNQPYNYEYDAIYRLIKANGYKQTDINSSNVDVVSYVEQYSYDDGGNLIQTQHNCPNTIYTSNITVANDSNRATNSNLNSDPSKVNDFFDSCGNQVKDQQASQINWSYKDTIYRCVTDDFNEYYLYDYSGNRVKKITELAGGDSESVFYLGKIQRRLDKTGERHALTIDDENRIIATRNCWLPGTPPGMKNPSIIYNLEDNIDSNATELDEEGSVISKEEFSPYGKTTIFIENNDEAKLKIHQYSSKEKDSTKFYYFGQRYYCYENSRWLNCDPAGTIDGLNLYSFVNSNPTTFLDIDGLNKGKKKQKTAKGAVKVPTHKTMHPKFEALGEEIGKSLFNVNLTSRKKKTSSYEKAIEKMKKKNAYRRQSDRVKKNAIRKGLAGEEESFARGWRSADPHTDEHLSTISTFYLLKGIGKQKLTKEMIEHIEAGFGVISQMRMPTSDTGSNDGKTVFQHPSAFGVFGPPGAKHNRWDRARRDFALEEAGASAHAGVDKVLDMAHAASAFTLGMGLGAAPATAKNMKTTITAKERKSQALRREQIKVKGDIIYEAIEGKAAPTRGRQKIDAPYKTKKRRRSFSPTRG